MTPPTTVKEVLVQARDLISDPKRWTQGGLGRKEGQEVGSWLLDKADCWCAYGAVIKLAPPMLLRSAAGKLEEVMGGAIGPFNDSSPHEDVLAAFDIAICLES